MNVIQKILQKFRGQPSASTVIQSVISESLSYLDEPALQELLEQVEILEEEKRSGILIEAGCALGGSALVIAAAKSKARHFFVYDVFGMIPPPSDHDDEDVHERYRIISSGRSTGLGGKKYYGYEENLFQRVTDTFHQYGLPLGKNNIHLIKGLFQDTLEINEPVALAHLDGDWYESVMTCLQRIVPHLATQGVLIVDDYYAWSGCRRAVDEYFSDKQEQFQFVHKSRLQIVQK